VTAGKALAGGTGVADAATIGEGTIDGVANGDGEVPGELHPWSTKMAATKPRTLRCLMTFPTS
jgi:hypothetical protein